MKFVSFRRLVTSIENFPSTIARENALGINFTLNRFDITSAKCFRNLYMTLLGQNGAFFAHLIKNNHSVFFPPKKKDQESSLHEMNLNY